DDRMTFDVRTDGVGCRAVAADVVPTGLWVIFDRENRHVRPEFRVAEGLDDPAERQIIVGNTRTGCLAARTRAIRMVLRQADENELRKLALFFELFQFTQDVVSAPLIDQRELPAHKVRRRK